MNEQLKAVWGKADLLVADIPHAVVVLQKTATDEVEPVVRVDERLAGVGVIREGPNAQLLARDGEVELLVVGRGEGERDNGVE